VTARNAACAGELDALVTAPVNKEAIIRAGHKFVGQTEFLSGTRQNQTHAMMLLGHDDADRWLRVALVTIHTSIKSVPEKSRRKKSRSPSNSPRRPAAT
jgi:4-hydroxy-L-threonine phosphate dehydrogenase PdxA